MRVIYVAALLLLCLVRSVMAAEAPLVDTASIATGLEISSEMIETASGSRVLEIIAITPGQGTGTNEVHSYSVPGGNPANGVTDVKLETGVQEANFGLSQIYEIDPVTDVAAIIVMNQDLDVALWGFRNSTWNRLYETTQGVYGEGQLIVVDGKAVFGGLNLTTRKVDFYEYDFLLDDAVPLGSFPQNGEILGALEGGYRFNLAVVPKTRQFTVFGMTPARQFNFWHLELGTQGIQQINICPVPIQPRTETTETSTASSPDGKSVVTTIDALNRYRTFLFTPNPVNVTEIWNGSTRRDAPPGVIGGVGLKFSGSSTLYQAYERADGDLDFVETLLNRQGQFLSENSITIPADNRTDAIAPVS